MVTLPYEGVGEGEEGRSGKVKNTVGPKIGHHNKHRRHSLVSNGTGS